MPETNYKYWIVLVFLLALVSCKSTKEITKIEDDGKITFKFIQLNDVYEIAPLSGGEYGGMARVAHIADSVRKVNPNTFMFMAGDFLNPSLVGSLKLDGETVNGRQMVEVMNAMNFELVTFGNHEFDVGQEALQQRLNESHFQWIATNIYERGEDGSRSFQIQNDLASMPIPETHTIRLMDPDSTYISIGFLSATINSNPQKFVYYDDHKQAALAAYNSLKRDKVDLIMGLTHLEIEQDAELAKRLPELRFIMGGHEHHNMLVPSANAMIAKADANAKTVYIHTFEYDKKTGLLKRDSQLLPVDSRIASQPQVNAIVERWNRILDQEVRKIIDSPYEQIYRADPPLDGTDSASRGIQTNLGGIITAAMADSFDEPLNAAIVNGGSIRVDDMLAGSINSLDVFRVLPFGGEIVKVSLKGSLLIEVLDYGENSRGTGAYLQRHNIEQDSRGEWTLDGSPIDQEQTYTVAMSDFLMKGRDIPFLTPKNTGIVGDVYVPKNYENANDIRKAVIVYLKLLNQ